MRSGVVSRRRVRLRSGVMTRGRYVLLGVVAALVVLVLVARAVVMHVVAGALAERGLVCDPVSVDPRWDLRAVEIARANCLLTGGERVTEIGLPYGATVELDGFVPTHVHAAELTVELAGEADLGALSGAFLSSEVSAPLRDALDALAASSTRTDLPDVTLDVVRIRQHRATLVVRTLETHRDAAGLHASATSIEPPAHHGVLLELEVRIEALVVVASATEVSIDGEVTFDGRIGRNEIARRAPFHVRGLELGSELPTYSLEVEGDLDLAAIDAGLEALGARRAAAAEGSTPIHDLAERLEVARERMEAAEEPSAAPRVDPTAAGP